MRQTMKIPDTKAAVDKEWTLQFSALIWSDAQAINNYGCESSCGQGMEEARNMATMALDKMKSKREVFREARTENKKVHFATWMDICHLQNAELELKHQKYRGRVVLRGDMVKTTLAFSPYFANKVLQQRK